MSVDTDSDIRIFGFKATQEQFLDSLIWKYGDSGADFSDELPEEIRINGQFRTVGSNGAEIKDKFMIIVMSSGQARTESCTTGFEALAMEEAFATTAREY